MSEKSDRNPTYVKSDSSDDMYGRWLDRYYGSIFYSQAHCSKEIISLLSKGLLPQKPKLLCDLGRFLYLEMNPDTEGDAEIEWLALNLVDIASSCGFEEATDFLEKLLAKYRNQAENGYSISQIILKRYLESKDSASDAQKEPDNPDLSENMQSKTDTLSYRLAEIEKWIRKLDSDYSENTQRIIDSGKSNKDEIIANNNNRFELICTAVITESEKIQNSVNDIPEKVKKQIFSELNEITDKFKTSFSEIEEMHRQTQSGISDIKQAVETTNEKTETLVSQMQAFFDKMDDRCKAQANSQECKKLRNACEEELKNFFGSCWVNEQLLESTKESLIAARVLLACAEREAVCDCRGIVISATSALETELKARFYTGVREYFAENGAWDGQNEKILPRNLRQKIHRNGEREDKFTLGDVYYILNCERYDTKELLNDYSEEQVKFLKEYLRSRVLSDDVLSNKYIYCGRNYNDERPQDIFVYNGKPLCDSFTEKLKNITNLYRNPAAHTRDTDKETACRCCNEVIGQGATEVKKIEGILLELLRLTEKFNHNPNS